MTVAPGSLLTQVAGERQTGALVVGGHPGGAVYVLEGRVIYAESPAAPGVGELLTASGRLAGRTWQNALDLGTSTARVGRLLVEQGHLTRGELEMCVLGAIYDAAYFALSPAAAPVNFLAGATHWLGAVVHVDPEAVRHEVGRRVRILDGIFPDGRVDTAAVAPAPRPPRERITLTALQWELLVHADGQRTPADLALLLGKAGFACVQELRRMAAMGLIELPETPAPNPDLVRLVRGRGTAVDAQRPVVVPDPEDAAVPVVTAARAVVPAPDKTEPPRQTEPPHETEPPRHAQPRHTEPPRPSVADDGPTQPIYRPARLARRKPGAKLPKEVAGEPPPVHHGTDEVLLKRIRTALRALR